MTPESIILYIVTFLYGIVIGSFLNVCIYRMPKKESLVTVGSHCMNCGHKLKWYDLFPLFSWIFLKGKCRYCNAGISSQYPMVEAVNGLAYCGILYINGWNADSVLYCLLFSALLVLSVIDYRTMMIPTAVDITILILGVIHLVFHLDNWLYYVGGLFFASIFLLVIASAFPWDYRKERSWSGRCGVDGLCRTLYRLGTCPVCYYHRIRSRSFD